jgi:hypothetical protein
VGLEAAPSPTNQPIVIAELFTSEGCSSCPPAEDVLSELIHRQPVRSVHVLALGEHVDYWDRLGWRDPFSLATLTARQAEYESRVFRTGSIYTPQLVVDGQLESVGSDANAVRRAITQAAQASKAGVDVMFTRAPDAHIRVDVHVDVPRDLTIHGTADVLVAVTEDNLVSNVRRGENRGRTLRHSAVVRVLMPVGVLPPQDQAYSTTASVPLSPEWKTENISVVSFVQERQSRRIVGAGSAVGGDLTATRSDDSRRATP